MWHKPCRTFHPWCLCIKTRCLYCTDLSWKALWKAKYRQTSNTRCALVGNKCWNWCRCIQRKDSSGVILTASWFNYMNIGYRFHTSTVCHSCCNNVMYISKENLDISGSAWKKYHADMAFLLARIVLVLKLYVQGESCVRSMQASAARLRPGSGILFMTYIDICIILVW